MVSLYPFFSFHVVSLNCFCAVVGNNQFRIILLFNSLGWNTRTRYYLLHPTKSVPVLFKYTNATSSCEKDWSPSSLTKAIIPHSFSKWINIIWLLSHWPALHIPFHKIHFVAHFSYSFTTDSRQWVNLLFFIARSSTLILLLAY